MAKLTDRVVQQLSEKSESLKTDLKARDSEIKRVIQELDAKNKECAALRGRVKTIARIELDHDQADTELEQALSRLEDMSRDNSMKDLKLKAEIASRKQSEARGATLQAKVNQLQVAAKAIDQVKETGLNEMNSQSTDLGRDKGNEITESRVNIELSELLDAKVAEIGRLEAELKAMSNDKKDYATQLSMEKAARKQEIQALRNRAQAVLQPKSAIERSVLSAEWPIIAAARKRQCNACTTSNFSQRQSDSLTMPPVMPPASGEVSVSSQQAKSSTASSLTDHLSAIHKRKQDGDIESSQPEKRRRADVSLLGSNKSYDDTNNY